MGIIPDGLTSVLHLFGIFIIIAFKDSMTKKWLDWMMNGAKQFLARGNVEAAALQDGLLKAPLVLK